MREIVSHENAIYFVGQIGLLCVGRANYEESLSSSHDNFERHHLYPILDPLLPNNINCFFTQNPIPVSVEYYLKNGRAEDSSPFH